MNGTGRLLFYSVSGIISGIAGSGPVLIGIGVGHCRILRFQRPELIPVLEQEDTESDTRHSTGHTSQAAEHIARQEGAQRNHTAQNRQHRHITGDLPWGVPVQIV